MDWKGIVGGVVVGGGLIVLGMNWLLAGDCALYAYNGEATEVQVNVNGNAFSLAPHSGSKSTVPQRKSVMMRMGEQSTSIPTKSDFGSSMTIVLDQSEVGYVLVDLSSLYSSKGNAKPSEDMLAGIRVVTASVGPGPAHRFPTDLISAWPGDELPTSTLVLGKSGQPQVLKLFRVDTSSATDDFAESVRSTVETGRPLKTLEVL